jgi:hypothetical protein
MAHVIESRNIPTLVIGTALDIMSRVPPPRAVFVDHPVGRTFGPPHDRQRNEAVLIRALAELPKFTHRGEIRDPHFEWELNGGRAWEEELRAEMLRDHGN